MGNVILHPSRWYAGHKMPPKNARPVRTVRVSTTSIRENSVDPPLLSISTPFRRVAKHSRLMVRPWPETCKQRMM